MFKFFSRKSTEPIPLWFSTDIHAHVIPGVDDGSPDLASSIELIKGLKELGIERILATPHIAANEFPNSAETLTGPFEQLKAELDRQKISLDLTHSAEYRIDDGLTTLLAEDKIIPFPKKFILIENQWQMEPMNLEQLIFDLQVKGYRPIMAHPERFSYYQAKPSRLEALHAKIPFQVNMLSLAGYYGKAAKQLAEQLAKKGMVDYLGTDTHRMAHIECFREYLGSRDALRHRDLTAGTIRNDRSFK